MSGDPKLKRLIESYGASERGLERSRFENNYTAINTSLRVRDRMRNELTDYVNEILAREQALLALVPGYKEVPHGNTIQE